MTLLANWIDHRWEPASGSATQQVINPATDEVIAEVPLSTKEDVDRAVQCAQKALKGWRNTPVTERIQVMFKYKQLLEENFEKIARGITEECGKTLDESRGELRRGIENVEVSCGAPMLIQGYHNEDIAPGIDELMVRQPVGVCAIITPFNFPAMIPLWFLPYALVCGNTVVLKPSERVPQTLVTLLNLLNEAGLPAGVANLVHGSKEVVDAILEHPLVKAVSFVGSTQIARYIYAKASQHGKRVQAQGGAKNPIIVLPDADMEMTTKIVADSAFGCAGQRCLASSLAVTVGSVKDEFLESMRAAGQSRKVGNGLEDGVQMGPLINKASRDRVRGLIDIGVQQGSEVLLDGREDFAKGSFLKPTVMTMPLESELVTTEIFGPVLGVLHFDDMDQVVEWINQGKYGNQACLFTSSGAAARKFRHEAEVGNLGINIGVAAPMAFFPFSGWKDSFFGDLHAQGRHGIEFYTQTKVVVERWPKEWSRKF
ncbi:MAG: CoA-acylating methylmalonate-semialdehyde dehydrogenase [Candidatus Eremiobacteraeota bacterium]|nr:CoA-acylating methylmalonate-semialdehyde dehydrogenase [Candidatus Eremiobacteraeota bacterium]